MRLLVSELAQAIYVMPAFNSKWKYKKLTGVVHVFENTELSHAQMTAKNCTKIYSARAQASLILNLLFGGVLVAIVVVCY